MICPKCGSSNTSKCQVTTGGKQIYRCITCKKRFAITKEEDVENG
jgi:transposase-like protein